jgi:hypothetical protein
MPLVDAIVAAHVTGRARCLDLLRLTVCSADGEWSQYAHSYIGFGLTPLMAVGAETDRKGTIADSRRPPARTISTGVRPVSTLWPIVP